MPSPSSVQLNPATGGASIATDAIGSGPTLQYQLVKIVVGDLGSAGAPVGASQNLPVNLAVAIPAGGNIIGKVGIDQTTPGTTNGVVVTTALPAGTNIVGKFTTDQTTPGTTDLVHAAQSGAWAVTINASSSGGGTPFKLISAANTNATSVKGSAGQVFSMAGYNNNASPRYLKFYDKASAPTVGTDIPVWVMEMPGNTNGAGANLSLPIGIVFSTGIAIAITGGMADTDTTAVGAADCVIDLLIK